MLVRFLLKITVYWTSNYYFSNAINKFNFVIVVFTSMNFSCVIYKFFFRPICSSTTIRASLRFSLACVIAGRLKKITMSRYRAINLYVCIAVFIFDSFIVIFVSVYCSCFFYKFRNACPEFISLLFLKNIFYILVQLNVFAQTDETPFDASYI